MSMTERYSIEVELGDGRPATLEFEAEFEVVDRGIGVYEYWGSIGRDIDLCTEVKSVEVTAVLNEKDECVWNELSKEDRQRLEEIAEEHAQEFAPDPDSYCDDGYDPSDYDRPDEREW